MALPIDGVSGPFSTVLGDVIQRFGGAFQKVGTALGQLVMALVHRTVRFGESLL